MTNPIPNNKSAGSYVVSSNALPPPPPPKATVVNIRREKCDEYCGRGSIFGNPYEIGRDGTREEVIARYRERWFPFLLKDKRVVEILKSFKGKKLGCFCKEPDREVACHVDCIAEYLNKS